MNTCPDAEGGQGVRTAAPPPPSPKNHKAIGFLSNTGRDPIKITKSPSQHSMLGHHWLNSKTFRWRADDGQLQVVFGSSPPSSSKKVRNGPPLKELSGSAHETGNYDQVIPQ